MSDQITTAFVNQYTSNVELNLQQMGSRFESCVRNETAVGKAAVPVEQVGAVAAVKNMARHADTPIVYTPHSKRWAKPADYDWADLIDNQDTVKMLIDPTSPYAVNGAHAINRAKDDEIINAFFATSVTGQDMGSTESFDTTNYSIASSSVGMTVAKLRSAKEKLMSAQVDVDMDPLYCAIASDQHEDLLSETQTTSIDYNTRATLVDGRIRSFMGFQFVDSERLTTVSSERACPAWAKSGMCLVTFNSVQTSIDRRPDKRNSVQVYVTGTFGGTRLEQGKVIRILCAE